MEKFVINGGNALYGKVEIQSAKNSVLPLIAGSIVHEGKTVIEKCPKLGDVVVMAEIINRLGGKAEFLGEDLVIDCSDLNDYRLPPDLTGKIRASLFMVGALLTRFNEATIATTGGCDIGERPIDIHINSLRELGVAVKEGEIVEFDADGFSAGKTKLPFKSVGATENLIMASLKRKGVTVIENCAKEPEIIDLANFLNLLGAKIKGAGTDTVTVEGVENLTREEIRFKPVADRIEAGTFLFAGAICGGEMRFLPESFENLTEVVKIIENNACKIYRNNGKIEYIKFSGAYRGFGKVVTGTYPGFPTDLQPQLVSSACFSRGVTVVEEKVFPKRFDYAEELKKSGADVSVCANYCFVKGKKDLRGADMVAKDLRGGASVILLALGVKGRSEISGLDSVDRGYFKLEEKFRLLGADIKRINF